MLTIVSSYFVKSIVLIFSCVALYSLTVLWLNAAMKRRERAKRPRRRMSAEFDAESIVYLANSIADEGARRTRTAHVRRFLREHGGQLPLHTPR